MVKFTVITGPMFSGKSEELIRRLKRFQYGKEMIICFKPRIDNRFDVDGIAAKQLDPEKKHFQMTENFPAHSVEHPGEVSLKLSSNHFSVIAFDEAQFFGDWFPGLINSLLDKYKKTDRKITILVAGLDLDAWRRPFGTMPALMAMADEVVKVTAVCFSCGSEANLTQKTGGSKSQIEVGSGDIYEARCRACHTIPDIP